MADPKSETSIITGCVTLVTVTGLSLLGAIKLVELVIHLFHHVK